MYMHIYMCVCVFFLPSSIDVAVKNDHHHYYFDKHMRILRERERKKEREREETKEENRWRLVPSNMMVSIDDFLSKSI